MNLRISLCTLLVPALAWAASATDERTPVPAAANAAQGMERDLGSGLSYFRIHALPAGLPPPEDGRPPPCVVDIRYVRTNRAGATAFREWLESRTASGSAVFVLANATTDRDLLNVLRQRERRPTVVTVGIAGSHFEPDFPVEASGEVERQAYDAFERGATIASLLTDNPGKIRYDETSLGRDHRAEPPTRSSPDGDQKAPATVVDPVLQRAVHLHRALAALNKL